MYTLGMSKIRRRINPISRILNTSSYKNTPSGVYSRRMNSEKKKVVHQTITIVVIAIVVLLAFVFIIIPGFFKLTGDFFDSSTPFQQADMIAPQVPILSAPPAATSSANIKVTGFGEPESDLILVLNGRKDDSIKINEDGSFEIGIILDEGENIIAAYSVDKAENESAATRDYNTLLDTQAPSLEILEPADGTSFESRAKQSINLKGKTDVGAKIYINNRVVFPNDEGLFEHSILLVEGENKIEVHAEDKAKNSTKIDLVYSFKL